MTTKGNALINIGGIVDGVANFSFAQLPGYKFKGVLGSNLSIGDNDLYTVPANKKAIIVTNATRAYNPSAGSISFYAEIKVSGVYYRTGASTTIATGVGSGANLLSQPMIINAGESISVNTSTTAGLNITTSVVEFDSISPFSIARILSLANGDNSLYTVTSGKSGCIIANGLLGAVSVFNGSGSSVNLIVYDVPSGGSSGSTNQLFASTALANVTATTFNTSATFSSGDSLVVNSNSGTAGQVAWVNYFEV